MVELWSCPGRILKLVGFLSFLRSLRAELDEFVAKRG